MAMEAGETSARTSEPEVPLTKRRRTALACKACRARKSRCDGRRPTCATCRALGFECEYEPSEFSANIIVHKGYVFDLEQRVKRVEQALQRQEDLLTGHLSACSTERRRGYGQPPDAPSTAVEASDGIRLDASGLEDPEAEDARTDGLAITFVNEQTSAFFGDSSNVAFLRYLRGAIYAIWKVKQPEELAGEDHLVENRRIDFSQKLSPSAMDPPELSGLAATMLPPAVEMENLLGVYFGATGSLFPFIHEPTFRETYDEFKASGFAKVRRIWLGLLNIIFAVAGHVDQGGAISAEERLGRSHIYYARAVALCSGPSRRTVSLEIVQYLLLVVLYLQGAQRSTETWSVHGLLVRTAIALGLHSDQAGKKLDLVHQEARQRTWLTVYCLDKVLSVTFGRPPSMPEEYVIVRLPVPWSSLQSSTEPGHTIASEPSAQFLGVSVELYRIMGRSLVKQYNSNLGRMNEDFDAITTIQSASETRQDLRLWASGLPSHLSIYPPNSQFSPKPSDQDKLRIILTLRYHSLNILIHRPLLCAMLRSLTVQEAPSGESLPYIMQLAVAEAHECISSAESTIDIVYSILAADKAGHNSLGMWFFTLYYGTK